MKTFLRAVLAACVVVVLVAYASGIDIERIPAAPGAVTFTDRDGARLGTILASDARHAVAVPLDRIAPVMREAIVAAEDARFDDHGALDARALVRAALEFLQYGESRSGGSTIAMQLARIVEPTGGGIRGKLQQIVGAERIAMRSERPAILAAYLNRAPFGGNLYGVEAAARTYYGTSAEELDLAQASLLAAVPNDPSRLALDIDPQAARARQRYVLARMLALHAIDPAAADRATGERVRIARHDEGIVAAPHALFALFPQVARAGTVRTTIDLDLQRFVQAQVREVIDALASRHVTDAAALVVDNATGDVLAYVGSPEYFSDAALGRNDGVRALRQPGSSLKPFTYELALERGAIAPTTILDDTPATFALPGGRLYQPQDYSGQFSGPVRVRYALANSLNVPAVRVLSLVGTGALLERLRALGFVHLDRPASYYGLGLTLGGGEVSLWENVQAYLTIARDGDAMPLHLVPEPSAPHAIGDAPAWALVTDMLADRHAREHAFGTHSVLDMPFDAAVKTGTSSDFRDTWTLGFTRRYTVGVWVGNFDGSAMRDVSGVTGAGPLWNRIMLHLHEREDPPRFVAPAGFARVSICATTGSAPDARCGAIVREWTRSRPRLGVDGAAIGPNASFRIVSPADGARFIRNDATSPLARAEAQLALRATRTRDTVRWTINGSEVRRDADGTGFWPIGAPGTYEVVARSGAAVARAHFTILSATAGRPPGFSFHPLRRKTSNSY